MGRVQAYVLFGYLGFTLMAAVLALAQSRLRPRPELAEGPRPAGVTVRQKYPAYIVINLLFLAASWLPQAWHALTALLVLLGALASREIAQALLPAGLTRRALPFLTAGLVLAAGWLEPLAFLKVWLAVMLVLAAASALIGPLERLQRRVAALAGGAIYLPLCLAAYLWVRQTDATGFRVVFLYLTVAANDAFAQITGQFLGRRPLAPRISPGKTQEGAVGGLLFAAVVGAALSQTVGWSYAAGVGMGLVVGLAGLVGDLTASGWKRALRLKDFSGLLGAHGGVLDRFDALIFAAPVFYLLLSWPRA